MATSAPSGPREAGLPPQTEADVARLLRRVQRRTLAARLLHNLSTDLGVACSLVALAVLVDRVVLPGLVSLPGAAALVCGAVCVSLLRTILFNRVTLLDAAILADTRLVLKERLATAVFSREASAVAPGLRQLLAEDAAQAAGSVDLPRHFPVRFPRRALWALSPAALALGMWLWLPGFDLLGLGQKAGQRAFEESQVTEQTKKLDEQLKELGKKAEEAKLPDAQKLLELLAKSQLDPPRATEKKSDPPQPSQQGEAAKPGQTEPRKEALVDLSRREDKLRERMEGGELDPLKQAKQTLSDLDLKKTDVTRKLQEALKDGDFSRAKEELSRLKQELAGLAARPQKELTPEEAERLQKLREELSRLSRSSSAMSSLSKSLGSASSSLSGSQGSPQGMQDGLEALSQAESDVSELAQLDSEMELLDQALELVKQTRKELADLDKCPDCGEKLAKAGGT